MMNCCAKFCAHFAKEAAAEMMNLFIGGASLMILQHWKLFPKDYWCHCISVANYGLNIFALNIQFNHVGLYHFVLTSLVSTQMNSANYTQLSIMKKIKLATLISSIRCLPWLMLTYSNLMIHAYRRWKTTVYFDETST